MTPKTKAPCAVALGYFDGVHLGHRQVLAAAVDWAAANGGVSVAFTFCFGSRRTKAPDLLSLSERCRRIRSVGIDRVACEAFDDIAALTPEQFVKQLLTAQLGADVVFCGQDFRFGAGAAGDVDALCRLCAAEGITAQVLPLYTVDGAPVSATRLRGLLTQGDIQQVNRLLGAPYAVDFPVVHGQHIGSDMGYPTINQRYPAFMQQPCEGVYVTAAFVNGCWVPAATGLGSRPTVDGRDITCESYLCRWQGDVYGDRVRVAFLQYLWPIRRYADIAGLQKCIADAAAASCAVFDALDAAYLTDG